MPRGNIPNRETCHLFIILSKMSILNGVVVVFVGFLTVYLVKVFLKFKRLVFYIDKLPGPERLWLPIGNALQIRTDHAGFFQQCRDWVEEFRAQSKLGIFRLWIGPFPYVIITKGVTAEPVFSSYKFVEKGPDYEMVHPWLGTGLLTSGGDKWRSRRKFLTPAFHFQILNEFIDVFYEQSKVLVECLDGPMQSGKAFDISQFVTRCTLDIICETAMGEKIHAQTRVDSTYVLAVYRASELVYDRLIKPFLRPVILYNTLGWKRAREFRKTLKTLHDFTDSVILERQAKIANHEDTSGRRKAFLDLLLSATTEDGKLLDNASIREEVDTFMFEGHDTTAAAASFAIFLLGSHPEVQQKAYEELIGIFGKSDRAPTAEDFKSMQYLDLVIKETLRLYPSVPMITRKCNEDLHIAGTDVTVPKGSQINLFILALQRDPDVFPEPDKFNPDRFLDGGELHSPFDFVPFSAGPRNCIGQRFAMMEEKTILSTVLRNYRIESVWKPEELKINGELITRPANGIQVKLFPR